MVGSKGGGGSVDIQGGQVYNGHKCPKDRKQGNVVYSMVGIRTKTRRKHLLRGLPLADMQVLRQAILLITVGAGLLPRGCFPPPAVACTCPSFPLFVFVAFILRLLCFTTGIVVVGVFSRLQERHDCRWDLREGDGGADHFSGRLVSLVVGGQGGGG